jgi:hypothetical protein
MNYQHIGMQSLKKKTLLKRAYLVGMATRDLRSSGMLRGVRYYFVTDVSGQALSSILNVPAVRDCLNQDDGGNTLSRNFGNQLPAYTA